MYCFQVHTQIWTIYEILYFGISHLAPKAGILLMNIIIIIKLKKIVKSNLLRENPGYAEVQEEGVTTISQVC